MTHCAVINRPYLAMMIYTPQPRLWIQAQRQEEEWESDFGELALVEHGAGRLAGR